MHMTQPMMPRLLLAAVVLLAAGCRDQGEPAAAPVGPWQAMVDEWTDGDPIPDFELIDQSGEAFRLSRYDDDHLLIGFVFSRCAVPAACPLTMKRMTEVSEQWAAIEARGDAGGHTLQLLNVTLDPEFDTPEVLARYGAAYRADFQRWPLATGPAELVAPGLPSLFHVLAVPDGQGAVSHTIKVALLGPGREPVEEWRNNKFEASDVIDLVLGRAATSADTPEPVEEPPATAPSVAPAAADAPAEPLPAAKDP